MVFMFRKRTQNFYALTEIGIVVVDGGLYLLSFRLTNDGTVLYMIFDGGVGF